MKTTINLDDEMEAALAELVTLDGSKKLAIKRATERDHELHTNHPILAQVWRDPAGQAKLARLLRHIDIHALDESVIVGRRLATSATFDVVDAHLAVMAERLGTFILTADPHDMTTLDARFETY